MISHITSGGAAIHSLTFAARTILIAMCLTSAVAA
jgi:hypothetical protein